MSPTTLFIGIIGSTIPLIILLLNEILDLKKFQIGLIVILLLLSLMPKIYFIHNEPYSKQTIYDVASHIDYIRYVATNLKLPAPYDCWECYQQPIYYISAALIYKSVFFLGIVSEKALMLSLQYYSLLTYYFFLIVSILIFKQILNNRQMLVATSLIAFWPSGTIHAGRVGNDILTYFIVSLSLLFLVKWWLSNKNTNLIKSLLLSFIGILTKTNAIVLIPVIFCCKLLKDRVSKKLTSFLLAVTVATTIILLINQRNQFFYHQDNWLVSNFEGIPRFMYVGNKLENFLYFDFPRYFQQPNIDPSDDNSGRQYFWLYLIKTSLFAELTIDTTPQQNMARYLSILILIIIVFSLFNIMNLGKSKLFSFAPLLLSFFSFLASLIIFRFFYPCACSNEFRYIYPILIPGITFTALTPEFIDRKFLAKFIYLLIIGVFISLSFIFYLVPT